MKAENAIEVHNVVKTFKIYVDKGHTLKEVTLFSKRRKYEERKVLDDISFEVKKGEAIGLIGHNGCGKSTTLKLLTKIMYPDSGNIEMKGRVSSLIELGAGFHPDMSGRENIYINASIFGLTRKEIDTRVNDIIAFSELEEFIDNPVRTYSSGMYMRLAFSVAINVDADILLIDEILAVGDANFQAKCFDKLREVKALGTTIVIVSHSLGQIEQICERCIWIDEGKIRMDGLPEEVDFAYLEYMGEKGRGISSKNIDEKKTKASDEDINENKKIEILEAYLVNKDGKVRDRFKVGEPVCLKIHYRANATVNNPLIGLRIYRCDNVNAYGINTQNERLTLKLDGEGWVECYFPQWSFVASQYHIDIAIREENMLLCDYKTNIITFVTYNPVYEEGIAHLEHEWHMGGEQ